MSLPATLAPGLPPFVPPAADLDGVMAILRAREARTGMAPTMLSGWDSDDAAYGPPPGLAARIAALPAQPHHYTYCRDFEAARKLAATHFGHDLRFNGGVLSPQHIAFAANGTQSLLLALSALRERGVRRLVIAAPCYYAVVAIAHHLGLATTVVPAGQYLTGALDARAIISATAQPATALLLTNPAYSLGVEYPAAHMQALLADLPAGTPVILDETRLGLPWKRPTPWYRANLPGEVLILRSPSKVFLLHGAKLGVLLGPPDWIALIDRLQEALLGSVAGDTEALALVYLETLERWQAGDPALLAWRKKLVGRLRRTLQGVLATLSGHIWQLSPIDSGPYVLAATDCPIPLLSSTAIAAEHGILLMTSSYFFHERACWQGFRIHLCQPPGQAARAIQVSLG